MRIEEERNSADISLSEFFNKTCRNPINVRKTIMGTQTNCFKFRICKFPGIKILVGIHAGSKKQVFSIGRKVGPPETVPNGIYFLPQIYGGAPTAVGLAVTDIQVLCAVFAGPSRCENYKSFAEINPLPRCISLTSKSAKRPV